MQVKNEKLKNAIPLTLTTHALLVTVDSDYMTMPMNKIARWLNEGPENNVYYYASIDVLNGKQP